MIVYVVGRYASDGKWELEGVFGSVDEAVVVCDEPDMFYAPVTVGERFESSAARRERLAAGQEYPLDVVYPLAQAEAYFPKAVG